MIFFLYTYIHFNPYSSFVFDLNIVMAFQTIFLQKIPLGHY